MHYGYVKPMDLRQLRHATVLARTGNFMRAAGELNITQPALSRSIQALEEELGVRLFERGRQGAQLTREGRLLVERAEHVRLTLGGLQRDMALLRQGELGEVGFGMGPMVAAVFLTDLLSGLISRHPRLQVHSHVNNANQLLEALLAERIDFFIHSLGQFEPDARVTLHPVGELPLALFVRARHPLAGRKRVSRDELADYPVMTGNAPQWMRAAAIQMADRNQPLTVNFCCDDFLTLKQVVQRTDAIWLTSPAVIMHELRGGKIVEIRQTGETPPLAADLVITTLAGRSLSPAANGVIGIFRKLFEDVQASLSPARKRKAQ
jgi:DNA-binding transcriptional LysR family regulator